MTTDDQTFTRRVVPALLGVVVAALYVPPVVSVGLRTDLGAHLLFAQQLEVSGSAWAPYYMFEQVTIILRALIPFSVLELVVPTAGGRSATWEISGVVTVVAAAVAAAEIIYFRLIGTSGEVGIEGDHGNGWTEAALSLGLLLVAPVTFLTWANQQLVAGYVVVTMFDGASTVLLKPFALLLFWFIVDRLSRERVGARDIWICAALSALAWHAKPSLAVCLTPVLIVYVAVRTVRRRPAAWRFLGLGFFLPTVLIAIAQTATSAGSAWVMFDPLATVGDALTSRGLGLWMFAPLLLASCLFPLMVVGTYPRRFLTSTSLILAWAVFAIGASQYYLFRITGRVDFGDLIGGAQIGLFILYAESARFALSEERRMTISTLPKEPDRRTTIRRVALTSVFVLQVACGLFLLLQEVLHPAAWW